MSQDVSYSRDHRSRTSLFRKPQEDTPLLITHYSRAPTLTPVIPPQNMDGGASVQIGKTLRKLPSVIRVLRVSTWQLVSGCEGGLRSRTPKHVAVGAIPELR